jgi:hypothetical protein
MGILNLEVIRYLEGCLIVIYPSDRHSQKSDAGAMIPLSPDHGPLVCMSRRLAGGPPGSYAYASAISVESRCQNGHSLDVSHQGYCSTDLLQGLKDQISGFRSKAF